VPSILEFSAVSVKIAGSPVKHGRAANDGRIDEPFLGRRVSTGNDQSGFRSKRIRGSVALRQGHIFPLLNQAFCAFRMAVPEWSGSNRKGKTLVNPHVSWS
jgi:hypothetical protein